jgi:hypothetical protein
VFAAVIVLTLALSIGANSAIFSVIDSVLLNSLPYQQPERIARIFLTSVDYPKFPLNPFDFRDFRTRSKSFDSLAAFTRGDRQLSRNSGEPEPQRIPSHLRVFPRARSAPAARTRVRREGGDPRQ